MGAKRLLMAMPILLATFSCMALTSGAIPPRVEVTNKGLLEVKSGQVAYRNWHSNQLTGKARVVLHIAAKKSASDLNKDALNALQKAELPSEFFQTTTVVNGNDKMWGTQKFIRNLLEERTLSEPNAQFVLDNKGKVRSAWGFQQGDSAVLVFDAEGTLLWYKEGRLDVLDIEAMLTTLSNEISRLRGNIQN